MKCCALLLAASVLFGSPVLTQPEMSKLNGRWRVKFALSDGQEKHLIFDAKAKGAGTFLGVDTAPENKPIPEASPAAWSITSNERVSFSGEIELPLGNCCRELGTLIFKGTFVSASAIKGRAIFITSTTDDENFTGYRSDAGTFTASREP